MEAMEAEMAKPLGTPITQKPMNGKTEEAWSELRDTVKEYVGPHDINILYSDTSNVIALYDKSDEETEAFITAIRTDCPSVSLVCLS